MIVDDARYENDCGIRAKFYKISESCILMISNVNIPRVKPAQKRIRGRSYCILEPSLLNLVKFR